MKTCEHNRLVLIKEPAEKLRCVHCHLTIHEDELESDFCPECWEKDGIKRRIFEKITKKNSHIHNYRCEECGILVKSG